MPDYMALAKVKCDLTGIPEKWVTDALKLEGIYLVTKNMRLRRASLELIEKYGDILPEMGVKISSDFSGIKELRGFVRCEEVLDYDSEPEVQPVYTVGSKNQCPHNKRYGC